MANGIYHWIHPRFFEAYMLGFPGELSVLSLEQKLDYFDLCRSLFVLEPIMASQFVNALTGDAHFSGSARAAEAVLYCLRRALEALPLNPAIVGLAAEVLRDPALQRRAEIVRALAIPEDAARRLEKREADWVFAHAELVGLLEKNPQCVGAAERLLQLDERLERDPGDWLERFACPKPLQAAWKALLFLHYGRRGLNRQALSLWPEVRKTAPGPYTLSLAGCVHEGEGRREMAQALWRAALAADPTLTPVRLRLEELERPLQVNAALPRERSVVVCLFSWNKAEDLERTLRSLAASRLGKAKVRLLLNGCTDDSAARVEAARAAFGETDFAVISLPVNVGVAAARNWLLSLPETAQADYVVFADDDIEVPGDWLETMLSVAESDPSIGVVGGKAVFPASGCGADRLQFLYRVAGLALPGLFKFSPSVPDEPSFDTGLYTFLRPCLTVMGCLVLLRGAMLRDVGPYDIRFNPSQVEDMDHDLSVVLKGYTVMYCGHVKVRHYRNSGSVPQNPAAIWLNHLKMSCKRHGDVARLQALSRQLIQGAGS